MPWAAVQGIPGQLRPTEKENPIERISVTELSFRVFTDRDWLDYPWATGLAMLARVPHADPSADVLAVRDDSGLVIRVVRRTGATILRLGGAQRDLRGALEGALNWRHVERTIEDLIEIGFEPVLADHD